MHNKDPPLATREKYFVLAINMKKSKWNSKTPPRTPERTPDRAAYPRDVFSAPPFSSSQTPPRAYAITPRRLDGASKSSKVTNRIVYLIRHGESKGQAAKSREIRQKDPNLLDCRLTHLGQEQARRIPALLGAEVYSKIDYIVCSPLTRALETAVLAFPQHPILVSYDLREVGSPIPENMPRKTKDVLLDLQDHLPEGVDSFPIDVQSLKPELWPRRAETPPKVVRRDRIRQVFEWLTDALPEHVREIAVVCHYHVIRTALSDPYDAQHAQFVHSSVHPVNARPIRCELTEDGKLHLADVEFIAAAAATATKKKPATRAGKR